MTGDGDQTGPSRVAYCECGAAFAGADEAQLFAAAQAHLAQHHPELMGAYELDVVKQMAEGGSELRSTASTGDSASGWAVPGGRPPGAAETEPEGAGG